MSMQWGLFCNLNVLHNPFKIDHENNHVILSIVEHLFSLFLLPLNIHVERGSMLSILVGSCLHSYV